MGRTTPNRIASEDSTKRLLDSPEMRASPLAGYDDVRNLARKRLPRCVLEFVEGGAGGEVTVRENIAAFARRTFDPHWLTDVAERDTATTVLGERVSMPLLLAPAGLARLAHPDGGELDAARAAEAAGTIFCVSIASSCSLEEIRAASNGPLWLQLYLWKNDDLVGSLADRARAAGYGALVLTIDVPVVGNRERDIRNGVGLPPPIRPDTVVDALRHPAWARAYLRTPSITMANLADIVPGDVGSIAAYVDRELTDQRATWERVGRLRRLWDGPLVIKGVLSARDALEAVRQGADAVYVSNHGGRQLDSSPATLDVLPEVVEAVGDRAEVLLDGGVRRGEDVVKARALGARACLAGRPWFLALGGGGRPLLEQWVGLVRRDVDRTLALVGVPRIDDVGPAVLRGTF
jgi:L-lactate dehydrogenase (cytochrome)